MLAQWMEFAMATVAARLLTSPILQEYDAFTVDLVVNPASVQPVEAADAGCWLGGSCRSTTLSTGDVPAMNPAEFGKLAARHDLVEIAEA